MSTSLIVGWREWVALPKLGLPAVKAKVDTGARTSALHAFDVEEFSKGGRRRVRFGVHPLADSDVAVYSEADVVDVRMVRSSSGHSERRVVIETSVRLGGLVWPIELTLADRRDMQFRMLLARMALEGRALIDPAADFLHGEPEDPAGLYG
jgi:hypothetical protein